MFRTVFLVVVALLASFAAQAQQAPIVLKLSQFLGPASFFARDFAEPWAHELEARTNGRVWVDLYDGTTPLGGVLNQASQVRAGTVDIALGLRGAEADKFPRTSVIEVPFLVHDAATGSRVLWTLFKQGAFGPEFGEYRVLALFVQNPGLVHTATKPVTRPSDLKGLRMRAPNQAVAVALREVGAVPSLLQVNDVMPAVAAGQLDGIITNWGNPLPGFNDAMHFHTDVPFYTAVFFVVMNKARFAALPPDVQAAIDAQSGDVLVERFGQLWNKWDEPVRAGATGPGQTVIKPDAAALAEWRDALKPVTDIYLADLSKTGDPDARAVYEKLRTMLPPR
jgi:TRAP-type C4-dicarboxylate transport system substrate-binding protein